MRCNGAGGGGGGVSGRHDMRCTSHGSILFLHGQAGPQEYRETKLLPVCVVSGPEVEIARRTNITGYALFAVGEAHGIHTLGPWDTRANMKTMKTGNEILAIPRGIRAILTCSMACTWVTTHLDQMKKRYRGDVHTSGAWDTVGYIDYIVWDALYLPHCSRLAATRRWQRRQLVGISGCGSCF